MYLNKNNNTHLKRVYYYLYHSHIRDTGKLEPIPGDFGIETRYTLGKSLICCRANTEPNCLLHTHLHLCAIKRCQLSCSAFLWAVLGNVEPSFYEVKVQTTTPLYHPICKHIANKKSDISIGKWSSVYTHMYW